MEQDVRRSRPGVVGWFQSLSLKNKLLFALLPSMIGILLVTGYVTYRISNQFTETALERSAKQQAMAMAHGVESYLERCRQELLFIAQGDMTSQALRDYLARSAHSGGPVIRELAYLSPERTGHVYWVAEGDAFFSVTGDLLPTIQPSPFLIFNDLSGLSMGEVKLFPVQETEYPFPLVTNANHRVSVRLVRMATPVAAGPNGKRGYLILGVDARELRNVLSLFNSERSPLYAFPRSDELRFAYLLNLDGWILFESAPVEQTGAPLSTTVARSGHTGTLGKDGLSGAFRPSSSNGPFWRMVADIRAGRVGCVTLEDEDHVSSHVDRYFLAYGPVRFQGSEKAQAEVISGVAFVDRSQLTLVAGYRHLDVMFVVTLATVALMVVVVFILSRYITRPIFRLARAVRDMDLTDPREVVMASAGFETNLLRNAVNNLVQRMREQGDVIRDKDQQLRTASLQERAVLEEDSDGDGGEENPLPEILGSGPRIARLKSDILKAARVGVDVLVIGETGTGKQLAAEAIHNHSQRWDKPFISINCGALDENLLLDNLFGHTKGAFTEAKSDRKGAFLEADGGTLFLDEIQAASLKVQQSLLRAIAMRKIKPLGSDREVDVNVRLIAATNADLTHMIEEKTFREDLYFRLKVITIKTPPLREHPESIPVLALHYLNQAGLLVGRQEPALSRGAVEKMREYQWPGNVRELVNCITRAAVMAEGDLIQAQDIHMEDGGMGSFPDDGTPIAPFVVRTPEPAAPGVPVSREPVSRESGPPPAPPEAGDPTPPPGLKLNERQRKAYPVIAAEGSVSRSRYQEAVGGDLPSRTAIYDLNDLVRKGLLVKVGSGPATRYQLRSGPDARGR